MTWQESYDDLWSKRDQRLDGWFMMDSPVPTVALSASYVLFVTVIGPRMMRDRKPFENLKMYMQVYNVVSVAISAYIMIEAGVVGWFGRYNMGKF